MKVAAERIPDSQALLNIEVEDALVEKYVERAYRRIVNRINVPGFRKGKAPRFMVERLVGKEQLFQEGVEIMYPDVVKSALEEAQLTPFDTPQWEVVNQQPLTLKVTVPLEPTVELGEYKDIRLTPEAVEVTDEDVEKVLEQLQEQQVTWRPVERPAKMGDRVTIDIDGAIMEQPLLESAGGAALIGKRGEQILKTERADYPVKEQPESLLPGFAEELVGLKAGDEKEFVVRLPDTYPEEKFAGKEAAFKVTCHAVREEVKPALDDEFAKTVGEFDTLEEVRQGIRENMYSHRKAEADKRLSDALLEAIVARSTVDIPPSLIEHEIDHSMENLSERVRQSGMTMERFLESTKRTTNQLREEFRESARKRLATSLVLRKIGEVENIQVAPEEIDAEISRIIEGVAEAEVAKVRAGLAENRVRSQLGFEIAEGKIIDHLVEIATSEAVPMAAATSESEAGESQASESTGKEGQEEAAEGQEEAAEEPASEESTNQ